MVSWLHERPTGRAQAGRQDMRRSAVVFATESLLLETLARSLERFGAATVSKHTNVADALDAVEEQRADLLLFDLRDLDVVGAIVEARELVPTLSTIVLVDPADDAVLAAARASGATLAVSQTELALAVSRVFEPRARRVRHAAG
jgi:DNA-binding NarL/FixJ family response regulator